MSHDLSAGLTSSVVSERQELDTAVARETVITGVVGQPTLSQRICTLDKWISFNLQRIEGFNYFSSFSRQGNVLFCYKVCVEWKKKNKKTSQFSLTCLLLSQVFHSDVSQHRTGHQSSQNAEHDAHDVVVADQNDRAHVMNLTVDCNLNTGKIIII